jgi:hypothetical protein
MNWGRFSFMVSRPPAAIQSYDTYRHNGAMTLAGSVPEIAIRFNRLDHLFNPKVIASPDVVLKLVGCRAIPLENFPNSGQE